MSARLGSDPAQVRRAAEILRAGGVVAFPTETVYGLGADARSADGVRAVFALKGRPSWHPLIVHVPDASHLERWARLVPPLARDLAGRFWPGPLTLILRRASGVLDEVTGGQDTVGLRAPRHPVAQALLAELGSAIAAPSANRFGRVSPTSARHVLEDFGDQAPLVLDGGPCEVGLESTIVDLCGPEPRLVRPGAVTREDLEDLCRRPLALGPGAGLRASGTLAAHYAPRARVELVREDELAERVRASLDAGRRTAVWVARRAGREPAALPRGAIAIDVPFDAAELARSLYEALREVDRRGAELVFVAAPDERGLGLAIADRLRRAAASRGAAGAGPSEAAETTPDGS